MDGNRRYARQRQVEKLIGHSRGFDKLAETLGWCRDLGVRQATIYAFSIENFKRPPDEVAGLMDLFRRQFEKLIEEFPKFDAFQICVRVYGRVDMLPADVQASVAKVVARTAKNDRFYLNVALAYTSRAEICSAI
ncbi:PREDICTED: dehydrodolichyl diphosphate synthase complex subunit DHDDS-like, partial [Rhagoletis zephyria]|uniref:dehydrodolichyl diphosphate synthase complex subunit DHDDS-like n=1 Tax=Rhagoletis zephyria TaxID=28612 RepID=UPI0008113833